jgi:hypothetical protein
MITQEKIKEFEMYKDIIGMIIYPANKFGKVIVYYKPVSY